MSSACCTSACCFARAGRPSTSMDRNQLGYMDSPVRQTSAKLLKMGFGLPLYIRPFADSRHGPDDIARLQCLIR
ncbi:hypothetical protein DA89_3397 [Vibrio cholerae]|nr:hypothetical protein DA89_3397 [Vibrio cholerae]